MRITLLLAFLSIFSLNAKESFSQNARITYSATNVTLESVLDQIEHQTDYLFIVNSAVDTKKKVSIHVKEASVSKVLNDLLKGTNVHYSMEGSHIVISSRNVEKKLSTDKEEVIVTGKIVDPEGEALLGVNVLLKGSTIGVISDLDGNYSIRIPKLGGELLFSYVGYSSVTVPVNKTVINVTMKEDSKLLGEVVVTAMGIERKATSLTYATQTVGGNELTRAKDANLINSLQGKSAGLIITPNAGGAGSASKILLRGNASIIGNNSPLIVVDGVPMTNEIRGATDVEGGAALGYGGSAEGSDALSQLNPDDIATITVLKGANSAALYGSAAANGVIMVTTKKGQEGAMRIDVSSSTTFESPLMLPQFQNTFGGDINPDGTVVRDSWGGRISDLSDSQLSGPNGLHLTRNPYDIADFFRIGSNFNNTIALSGGTEKVQTYFSYGNTTAKGIYPDNQYERHNVTFRENFSFFKNKLKVNVSGSYIYQKVKNRTVGGGDLTNTLPSLYIGSRNVDLDYYKNNYQQLGTWQSDPYTVYQELGAGLYESKQIISTLKGPLQIWPYSVVSESNNPWWNIGMNSSGATISNKIFGSVALIYQIIPDLSVQVRFKYDRYMEEGIGKMYANTRVLKASNEDRGRYNYHMVYTRDIFTDAIVSYNKDIKDFRLGANIGGSMTSSKGDTHMVNQGATAGRAPYFNENLSVNYFDFDGLALGSGAGLPSSNWERGLFATAQLAYKEKANIEASYREDWYRAFTQFKSFGMKQHYGYYSFGGNVLLNEIFSLPNSFNLLKVRLSYSDVGNSIPNRLLRNSMSTNTSTGGMTMSNLQATTNLKPETTSSTEVGFDLSMLNHTFNMDVTFYNAVMKDQFITMGGTAGKTLVMNAGKVRNRGVEMTASYLWDINRDFSWKTGVNFSYNKNKILSTAVDDKGRAVIREITLSGDGSPIGGGLKLKFDKGGSYGDLYACQYQRRVDGSLNIDANGKPQFDLTKSERIGNMNANVNLGWNNTFTYKDFSLYVLIDGKVGGKVISFTEAFLDQRGVSERSGQARESAIANNVYFKPNMPGMTIVDKGQEYNVSVAGYYQAIGGACGREYVYDATSFRLREISAGYTFRNLFGNSKNLSLSFIARNLCFLYKNAPVDPDVSLSASNALGGIDLFNLPTTRSFGLSVKATF